MENELKEDLEKTPCDMKMVPCILKDIHRMLKSIVPNNKKIRDDIDENIVNCILEYSKTRTK